MFKIALTAGHYKGTPGKDCLKSLDPNETKEWVLNGRIADKVEKLLKAYDGYELLRTDDRTGEKNISNKARCKAANKFGADFYLSIHHNAGIDGGSGGGIVAYIYNKTKKPEAKEWQKALYDALIRHTGLKGNRSTPLASANFEEVRETKMPAVLLELGFMDSTVDTPIILTEAHADKCAAAIVEVLVDKGGLTKKPTKKTVEEVARETIAGKWGNGSERKTRLTAAGYNYNEVQAKVNELCGARTPGSKKKTVEEVARETIAGRWGNGTERKVRLAAAGYNYNEVQAKVNEILK